MSTDDKGWFLHFRDKEKQWELSYRVAAGNWRKHRVPRQFATEVQASKYAAKFYDAKKQSGFTAAPPRGRPTSAPVAPTKAAGEITFATFGEEWTSGRLHRRHPDHVRLKHTSKDDTERLALLAPAIGDVPLASFTLDDAERAMSSLEELRAAVEAREAQALGREPRQLKTLSSSARRHYAQVIGRVLKLAVYPGRHITSSPIPRGWLPRPSKPKARAFLYPAEDAQLLACTEIPLWRRLLWGFIAREGTRGPSEALSFHWRHVDLERGLVRLDVNKTDDPRVWSLTGGTVRALDAWKEQTGGGTKPDDLIFVREDKTQPSETHLAGIFRADLRTAGIDRAELFEHTSHRLQIRAHDLRASFITVALANGKSETWVTDRTGHTTSGQLMNYRRSARTFAEARLGDWLPLDEAIPELRSAAPPASVPGPANGTKDPLQLRARIAELVAFSLSQAGLRGPGLAKSSELKAVRGRGVEPLRLAAAEPKGETFREHASSDTASHDETSVDVIAGDLSTVGGGVESTSPRQAAISLRRELVQLEAGDVTGAAAVLLALLRLLESEP